MVARAAGFAPARRAARTLRPIDVLLLLLPSLPLLAGHDPHLPGAARVRLLARDRGPARGRHRGGRYRPRRPAGGWKPPVTRALDRRAISYQGPTPEPEENRSLSRLRATYHIRCDARSIEERARAIAVEQSVEMPVVGDRRRHVLSEIVGRVEEIARSAAGLFEARIALARRPSATTPDSSSTCCSATPRSTTTSRCTTSSFRAELAKEFGGPRHGLHELRRRVGASMRALTCSALKPQGLPPAELAGIAGAVRRRRHRLHQGRPRPRRPGLLAVRRACRRDRGGAARHAPARYIPSLSGDLDAHAASRSRSRASAGIDTVMVAPMVIRLANFHRLVRDHPDMAFVAHPRWPARRASRRRC